MANSQEQPARQAPSELSATQRARLILEVALASGDKAISAMLTRLLAETRLVHGREVADLLDTQARIAASILRAPMADHDHAHAAVDLALERRRIGDLSALDNLIDVVGLPRD